ncbi:ABC transporter permease subunit [Ruminococcaceae bacterium OttesenSCG-928-L11]|nr:ABC transporter permease subunit [Ruminococcaceae bacterium OttesenSCG-928-L11]
MAKPAQMTASRPSAPAEGGWARFKKNFPLHKYYYLLMIPGLATLLVFRYAPMAGIVVAFKDYRIVDGIFGSQWVGLRWFEMLFSNAQFTRVLFNTIYISLLKLLVGFPAPILLSIFINEISSVRYKKAIQTAVYLPHFISWVVIGGILVTILSPSVGILSLFHVTKNPLLDPSNFRWLVVLSDIWKEAGWGTVVYLAAITNVNTDLYEAATVDGANRFQRIIHITLPAISGTIAVMLILRTGSLLSAGFDQMYVLQTPATMDVGDVLDTFVYRYGLAQGRFSYAAAAGLFQSVVGLILVGLSNYITTKMGQDSVW